MKQKAWTMKLQDTEKRGSCCFLSGRLYAVFPIFPTFKIALLCSLRLASNSPDCLRWPWPHNPPASVYATVPPSH